MLLLAILFYISSIILGICAVCFFLDKAISDIAVKYGFAFPIGFVLAAFIVLAMDFAAGGFRNTFIGAAIPIMLFVSYVLYRESESREMLDFSRLRRQISKDKLFYVLAVALIAFIWALQIAGVHSGPAGIYGRDNFGTDFLFHISIGNSVIYSGWPPKLLYAYKTRNVFPFIADFYNAILMFNGIGPVTALYMTNLVLYFAIVMCATYFISLILKNRIAALAALIMFLFCSLSINMVLIALFRVSLPYLPYSQMPTSGNPLQLLSFNIWTFADPISGNFAPQHDYLLGFPLAIMILTVIYKKFIDKDALKHRSQKISTGTLAFAGLIAGLLPLTHPFSLVFVFIFALVWFAYSMMKKDRLNSLLRYRIRPIGK